MKARYPWSCYNSAPRTVCYGYGTRYSPLCSVKTLPPTRALLDLSPLILEPCLSPSLPASGGLGWGWWWPSWGWWRWGERPPPPPPATSLPCWAPMLSRSAWRGTIPAGDQEEKLEGRQIVMISTLVGSKYLFVLIAKMALWLVSSWYVYLASLLCSGCWFGNSKFTTLTATDLHFYISIPILLHCLPLLSSRYRIYL